MHKVEYSNIKKDGLYRWKAKAIAYKKEKSSVKSTTIRTEGIAVQSNQVEEEIIEDKMNKEISFFDILKIERERIDNEDTTKPNSNT